MTLEPILSNYNVLAYYVLNSTAADFVGLFFPMLVEKKMNAVVKKIVEYIDKYSIDDIKLYALPQILKIFKVIVNNGFGNIVFSKTNLTFDLKNTLEKEMLAKAIYVRCAAISPEGNKSIWRSCEEMLSMTGLAPITDGVNTYLVEDRQHDEIQQTRRKETSKAGEQQNSFRFHSHVSSEEIATRIITDIRDIYDSCNAGIQTGKKYKELT
ncbi:hypothetical protein FACS189472_18810 [Alphaproteobacteria bacterium]|nr:hypothetical protein FACS189472_18810 [Alphaproteobacteria bacterium]